jgi:hypothetical protein
VELVEALDAVHDASSLLEFARLLAQDRADETKKEAISPSSSNGRGSNGWENVTIEAFLEGAIAWAEATDFGLTQGLSPENPWRRFADFLYCGKIYE